MISANPPARHNQVTVIGDSTFVIIPLGAANASSGSSHATRFTLANPHPHFSFVTDFFTRNYPIAKNNGGRGIDFPLEQETDVAGKVDIEQLVIDSARGLDIEKQKSQVTAIALVFNELVPILPLYERYGNNAGLEGVRVKAWPADDDPMLKQAPYADGIPTMLMYTGKLEAV